MSMDSEHDETQTPEEGTPEHAAAGPDHDHEHDHHEGHGHDHANHEMELERVGSRISMKFTVAAEEVAKNVDEVTKVFRQRAKMQGFRRGKAPMSMVRQRYKEEIRDHVLEHMVPAHLGTELDAHSLQPLHNPVLENVDFDPERPLAFAVHFDVMPEISVSGYKDLEATKSILPITDEALDKAIDNLRERAAKIESVDANEGARPGDYVRASIALFPSQGKGKKLAEEDRYVHLGEEQAIPGLNVQLENLEVGASREFVTELGEAYPHDLLAGKEVTCRAEVTEIKRRHLPAIDDDLARDLGLESLDELREKTREDFGRHVEEEAERGVERRLLDQVIDANSIDTPASMVEARLDQAVQRAAQELAQQGIDPRTSMDWSRFRADNTADARRAVSEELLLDGIAAAENIEVAEDDVVAEIESHQEGQAEGGVAILAQQMRKDGSFEGLRRAMVRRRALDFVKQHATIETVEEAPETPDLSP